LHSALPLGIEYRVAQGCSFACLPLLWELDVEATAEQDSTMYDGTIEVDLAGLPASLQCLRVLLGSHLCVPTGSNVDADPALRPAKRSEACIGATESLLQNAFNSAQHR
jgi:hypothetical protein